MKIAARLVGAALLLALAAWCALGFLATFEPPGFVALRLVYAAVAVACAIAATLLVAGLGAPAEPRR